MRNSSYLFTFFLAYIFCSASLAEISIIHNSRIVADEKNSAESSVAVELSDYLERITGIKVPVVSQDTLDANGIIIAIGNNRFTAHLDALVKGIDIEGFIIDPNCNTNILAIRGPNSQATQFGVYYFLQKYCGIRWYLPASGTLGTVIPKKDDISFPKIRIVEEPDYKIRMWGGWVDEKLAAIWDTHNLGQGRRYTITHNTSNILPTEKYWDTHPEYYAMLNGQREKPMYSWGHACVSNPEVKQLFINYAKDIFSRYPDTIAVSLAVDDGDAYCECQNCKAMDTPEQTLNGKPQYSERMFKFYNEVACEIKKDYPQKTLGVLAYSSILAPPFTIDKLEDNIVVWLPTDRTNWFNPQWKADDQKLIESWSEKANRLVLWNWFHGSRWLIPRGIHRNIAEIISFAKKLGNVEGMYSETYTHVALEGPKMWILAQMLWDSNLTYDMLLDDYCTGMFGKASPWMRRYYDHCELVWELQPVSDVREMISRWGSRIEQMDIYTDRDMRTLRSYLKRAAEAADTPPEKERVKMVANAFHYFDLIWSLYQTHKQAYAIGQIDDKTKAEQAGATLMEMLEGQKTFDEFQNDVVASRPELQYYMGMWWHPSSGWLLAELMDYYRDISDVNALSCMSKSLQDKFPETEAGRLAGVLTSNAKIDFSTNIAINPGLKPKGFKTNDIRIFDWIEDELTPSGWYRWPAQNNKNFISVSDSQAKDGIAAGIRGPATYGMCYVQTLPIESNKSFIVECLMKPHVHSGSPAGFVAIEYWDKDKNWLDTSVNSSVYSLGSDMQNDRWYKVVGIVKTPETAKYLVVGLKSGQLASEEQVLFDDVNIVSLE